jgi:hypothetical protein
MKSIAILDTIRTLAYTSITTAYVAVGTAQLYPAKIICFTNTTNQNAFFSMDGVHDQVLVPANGFKLYDVTTNHRPVNQDDFVFATGTQWYVKQPIASTSGSVYIEIIHTQP